jgi:hypothetical protein
VQQNFIDRVSICNLAGAKVMILNRKFLKFEIDLDFVLIAVTTSQKDYRICYLINKYLNVDFVKSADLEIDISGVLPPAFFSLYRYTANDAETDYYFIANKGSEGYLIPEMSKVDFFLMIKNHIGEMDLDKMISALNKIPEVVSAAKIDPKKIKSRENLLF